MSIIHIREKPLAIIDRVLTTWIVICYLTLGNYIYICYSYVQ